MKFNETRPLYMLEEIAAVLRGENGCAWDRAQTLQTLKPYVIEEAHEVYDAIESSDMDHVREELGDLLYQVYAQAQIAAESGGFTVDDVAEGIIAKLIRRHPHVFGGESAATSDEVLRKWEKIKKEEKPAGASMLDGVPKSLPALHKAFRVQQKVSRVGFDWRDAGDIFAKLDEEVREFRDAFDSGDADRIEDEIGDILFTVANIARFVRVNPEEALQHTVGKFIRRFQHIEQRARQAGKALEEMSLEEMDAYWNEAKEEERR